MPEYAVIGKRVSRIDAAVKSTGQAKFCADMKLPGMLYGKILRSPHPHARILSIDTSQAKRLPGVKAVIIAKDTPLIKFASVFGPPDRHILCYDKVNCVGDPVAAVAAVDEDTAEAALELIKVEYEPLPAVFEPLAAMEPGAPQIHEHATNNILLHANRHFGDYDKGLAEADYVFEDTFATQPQCHAPLEGHNCIAEVDNAGNITLWSSSQGLDYAQRGLSAALSIPCSRIRVATSYIGGGFGGKAYVDPMYPTAVVLAQKTARPVKILYTREEELAQSGHRHPIIITLKTGVKKDGAIVSRSVKSIVNLGAYDNGGTIALSSTGYKTAQLNAPPNYKFEGFAVYTNNATGNAYRGWGGPQCHFAMESQMDMMAERLGLDPLEIRLKNANQPGHLGASGALMSSVGLSECLTKTAKAMGWKEWQQKKDRPANRGMGMACFLHAGGGAKFTTEFDNFSEAYIKIDSTGAVNILLGEQEMGSGAMTTLAMIAAEELGVRLEDIRIRMGDTGDPLSSFLTGASRVTFVAGNAVKVAAAQVKKQLFETASDMLEASVEDLDAREGMIFVKGSPDKGLPLTKVVSETSRRTGVPVALKGTWVDNVATGLDDRGYGNYTPCYSFGAQGAEVEVDTETGHVKLINFVDSQDCGFVINPMGAEGQMEGGAAMGIGYGLMEGLVKKDGRTLNPNFADYKMPGPLDLPPIRTLFVEPYEPHGPFGAKALGEPAMVPTAAALANAIYNAVGVRIKTLPITPAKILEALKEKEGNS